MSAFKHQVTAPVTIKCISREWPGSISEANVFRPLDWVKQQLMAGTGLIAFDKLCEDSILKAEVAVDTHCGQQRGLDLSVQFKLPFELV